MDDIKSLVVRNSLQLPDDQVKRLTTMLYQKSLSYLSPDKEEGPFLLYAMGNDFETIALKTNYPIDIIYLTAIRYDWLGKATLINKVKNLSPAEIQKDIANTLLIATWVSIQRELGEVMSGKKAAKDSKLIPQSTKSLSELIDMVNKVNGLSEVKAGAGSTIVNATNVQIQNYEALKPEETEEEKAKKAIKIKMLES